MSADSPGLAPAARWLRGWAAPIHRDGLALVLSSGLSSVLGLLYWVVAARLFSTEVVGVNSVTLSTMMLLGGVAQLNLNYMLLRFLPVAGGRARRLVVLGYLVSATLSAAAAAIFVAGAGVWAPELLAHTGRGRLLLLLVPATALWAIFTLQDFVLTAVKRATVVPVENLAFALLKIALLVAAVGLAPHEGIVVSWTVATAAAVVVTNGYLFWRALPAHEARTRALAEPLSLAGIGRFVGADYAGAVCWLAATFGLPMIVIAVAGPTGAATYNIVWAIAFALYLVSSGMGQSLVAHVAAEPDRLPAARRAMEVKAAVLLVPAVAMIVFGAPVVLGVFGPEYAETGTGLLALAALSALPNIITTSTVSVARVRRQVPLLFAVPASVAVLTIGLSLLTLPRWGVIGVGAAWLTSQTLVASVVLVLRSTRLAGRRRSAGVS
ncbi:lipopolysaccharide biosynthesis protein [Pseudonocardia hispaniensis]|uniref:Lipopolysaccharide biosynthesis protein n=1 Tax=Pseudonocardia hispaniensis TaxID=904933 RepID=A0ABW1IYU9_9PSEU